MTKQQVIDRAKQLAAYDIDENIISNNDADYAIQMFYADMGFVEVTETIPAVVNQTVYTVNNVLLPRTVLLNGQELPRVYDDNDSVQAFLFEFPRLVLMQPPPQSGTITVVGYGMPTSGYPVPSGFEQLCIDACASLLTSEVFARFRDMSRAQFYVARYHNTLRRLKPRALFVRKPRPVQGSVDVI